MFLQFGAMQPLGPGLVILLMLLLLIWTAYRKVRQATRRSDLRSDLVRARLHRKDRRETTRVLAQNRIETCAGTGRFRP